VITIYVDDELTTSLAKRAAKMLDDARPMGISQEIVEAKRTFFAFAEHPGVGASGFDVGGLARSL